MFMGMVGLRIPKVIAANIDRQSSNNAIWRRQEGGAHNGEEFWRR
jgi:hypothetical protein